MALRYPFYVQPSQPPNACTHINLTCTRDQASTATPMLHLPYGGDFYVRFIEYSEPYIQLSDPGGCLMRRLMRRGLNLSSSPFFASFYENYTFYTCPAGVYPVGYYVFPIECLSNLTNVTVAATDLVSPGLMRGNGCDVVGRWMLPVLGKEQFDFDGVNGDLYLKWGGMACEACEDHGGGGGVTTDGSTDSLWARYVGSTFFIPSFVAALTFSLVCFAHIVKHCSGGYEIPSASPTANAQPESTAAPPQHTATGGLDDSKINSCTELVVINEDRTVKGVADCNNCCSICLESYVLRESVRSITKCEHCFHADCIELWLRKNRTCPVCRTAIVDC